MRGSLKPRLRAFSYPRTLFAMSRRQVVCLVVVAVIAAVGGVLLISHLTAASARSEPTSLAQAEAKAAVLLNRAAVGQLDKQGEVELHALIRRYHLVLAHPKPCKAKPGSDGTSQLSCTYSPRFIQAKP